MKRYKLTKTAILCVLSIMIISSVAFAYTKISRSKEITKILTESNKIQILADMNKELEIVKEDIKKTHELSGQDYLEIDLNNIASFTQGKVTGFSDIEFTQTASTIIFKAIENSPIGSLKPIILVKKDKTEILVAYKDKDGNNVLEKSKKFEDGWKSEKSSKIGSKVPTLFSAED